MSLEMKIHREIELRLSEDEMYRKAEEFGELAIKALGRERGKTQLRNLENIANSTLKVSDVLDYIKRQTARLREWKAGNFGAKMLTYFQNDIARKRDDIMAYLSEEFKDLNEHTVRVKKQDIHLRMIRGIAHSF
jgi:hypothetical protein